MRVRFLSLTPKRVMYLFTATDLRTMKKQWHFGSSGCDVCQYRFECFTDDTVHVNPVRVDYAKLTYPVPKKWHRKEYTYKAEFHLPKCLRIGLYKQIADTGYFSRSYREYFGDGFKLGAIVEEGDERICLDRSWIKLPNILYVAGTLRYA